MQIKKHRIGNPRPTSQPLVNPLDTVRGYKGAIDEITKSVYPIRPIVGGEHHPDSWVGTVGQGFFGNEIGGC